MPGQFLVYGGVSCETKALQDSFYLHNGGKRIRYKKERIEKRTDMKRDETL